MLTSELIRPRLRIHGSTLRVEMVHEQDPALQQIAQDLICLFQCHQGQSQAAWQEAVRAYEGTNVDYVFIRNNTVRQRMGHYVRQTLSFSKSDAFHEAFTKWFVVEYNRGLSLTI